MTCGNEIAGIGLAIIERRQAFCMEHERGLGWIYDRLDEGAFEALRALHRQLDEAVCAAYGWSADLLDDVRVRNAKLYELNVESVEGRVPDYQPF